MKWMYSFYRLKEEQKGQNGIWEKDNEESYSLNKRHHYIDKVQRVFGNKIGVQYVPRFCWGVSLLSVFTN